MKIKTSELEGAALDWAAAKAAGIELHFDGYLWADDYSCRWAPSIFWNQCGPLIERFSVNISHSCGCTAEISSGVWNFKFYGRGSTPLIAACRAIVAAELGNEVDVPEGLQ